jgi:hypothetical protein
MKTPLGRVLLAVCLLLVAVAVLLLTRWRTPPSSKPDSTISPSSTRWGPTTSPPAAASATALAEIPSARKSFTQAGRPGGARIKIPAADLTADEKTQFEKEFTEKIKPAVEAWCKIYAGHVPFRFEDLTPDKFRERYGKDPSFYDYGFVINGTTLSVVDYHGEVFVAYLASPAASQLLQLPKNPEPPKAVSVTREEILRLLKADSGQDFPANQIAMRPTAYAGAMNGGVSVDVGEGVNAEYAPLFKYSIVFGPDGNLACYLRRIVQK